MSIIFAFLFYFIFAAGSNTDYSEYSFTDISYYRATDGCGETIEFGSDGSFSYWEDCGNPVGDSDLCTGYTFDEDTNTVTLIYPSEYDEAYPREIEIISYDDEHLEVTIDGEKAIYN